MRIVDTAQIEAYKSQIKVQKNDGSKKVKIEGESTYAKVSVERTITDKAESMEPKDQIDISLLREEAEKAHAHLRQIVEDLLRRQGIEVEKLADLKPEDIQVDQQARDEAKQMIDEGGPLSPEAVSDRIVDFAKAISNGDKSKLELLREAIDEGFEQAKNFMGGELPEITDKTYELIQEKLDAWEEEQ
ncbi:hypothetical protein EZV73_13915 [Acidaminobacter sp. JC074]|uniref:hypothetical protein n=1 Tax=Acidaminobacter sp. JC074 TaxID=2530199 RepID=UPI001F0E11EB|nr:hypothetical protein [Acidaminobacter sp. JC074]MCH4888685.1 hypothetical protein [Acidaminobacter sp. JC074]